MKADRKEHRKEIRKPDIEPGYFDAYSASRYLNVSKSYFEDHVRPLLTIHDFRAPGSKKPMPKFARADLDEWAQSRRREKQPEKLEKQPA